MMKIIYTIIVNVNAAAWYWWDSEILMTNDKLFFPAKNKFLLWYMRMLKWNGLADQNIYSIRSNITIQLILDLVYQKWVYLELCTKEGPELGVRGITWIFNTDNSIHQPFFMAPLSAATVVISARWHPCTLDWFVALTKSSATVYQDHYVHEACIDMICRGLFYRDWWYKYHFFVKIAAGGQTFSNMGSDWLAAAAS